MIPESRGLRQGCAQRCQKSMAAHTQAGSWKTRTWKRACKGSGALRHWAGGSNKKPKDGRKKNKYGEMSNAEQPGPRKRSFLNSLRCCMCWELDMPPFFPLSFLPQPSPAPMPGHRETSSTPQGHLKPQDWRGQALLLFPRTVGFRMG